MTTATEEKQEVSKSASQPETKWDFSKAERGKYYARATAGGTIACTVAVNAIADALGAELECGFDKKEFHRLCDTYENNRKTAEAAKEMFERSRADLQTFVDQFGFVPTGADKTIRCATAMYQADVRRGTNIEINDNRVVEFQSLCRRARIAAIFPTIFQRRVDYSLVPKADKVIETAPVPKKYALAFHSLYNLCFTPKPKAPSLSVIDVQAEATAVAKKIAIAEAKKVAKKAAKVAANKAVK